MAMEFKRDVVRSEKTFVAQWQVTLTCGHTLIVDSKLRPKRVMCDVCPLRWNDTQRKAVAVADGQNYAVFHRERAKDRRIELSGEGVCINGRSHGPPVEDSVRCAWCRAVHRIGVERALVEVDATQRPPNYKPRIRVNDITEVR
jgi:hypothetical protein